MDGIWGTYTGIPIIVTDKRRQKRVHRKKRINKKWIKRYGFIENNYPYIEDDKVIMFAGKLYVNEKTFLELKDNYDLSYSLTNNIITNSKIIQG